MASNKYGIWIKIVSVLIPVVVAILFTVRIPDVEPLSFLPPIYATINGFTALLLILALRAIKSGKRLLHERLMKTCIALSLVFLVMYIAYHMTSSSLGKCVAHSFNPTSSKYFKASSSLSFLFTP